LSEEIAAVTRDVQTAEPTRLIGFSDAFFPIIITILVLEIHLPEAGPGGLAHALVEAWPSYAAFVLAFLYVGIIWLNHHGVFQRISRVDKGLNWINLGVLGTAALIPFPTRVLADALQSGDVDDQRAAVILYSLFAALMSASWAPLFTYLERHRSRLAPAAPPGYFGAQRRRPWIGVACYLTAILAALMISPWVGMIILASVVVFHALTSEGVAALDRSRSAPLDEGPLTGASAGTGNG
jgi:uncharacterized membrane protein